MIQKIVAMDEDRVDIRPNKIFVNNQEVLLPHIMETPFNANDTSFTLQLNQYFMISDHHAEDSLR